MATAKNLTELKGMLKSMTNNVMVNEVASKVRDIEQRKIQTEVYDAYESEAIEPYERRGDGTRDGWGGLQNRDNMVAIVKDNGDKIEMSIVNMAHGDDDARNTYLAPWIESGTGYYWKNSEVYYKQPFPRPFTKETYLELESSNEHVAAMKIGLTDRLKLKVK